MEDFDIKDLKLIEVNYIDYVFEIKQIYEKVFIEEFGLCEGNYKTDKYDGQSIHILACKEHEYVGYIRLIKPNEYGLPAVELVQPHEKIKFSSCVEFSKLMVTNDHRKRKDENIALRLIQKAFVCTLRDGYKNILVDVFKDTRFNTYNLFKSLGLVECSLPYKDYRYHNDCFSVLMFADIPRIIKNFERQKYFLDTINEEIRKLNLSYGFGGKILKI